MESQKKLVEDLLKSKVFLVPGHKAELYCLAAEEARELCIPIVTMGIGSLYERVEHGKTGFIAKNENEFASYTLELFNNDDKTKAVMIIGEIGGPQEAEAAEYVQKYMKKPVAAYIAGLTAPKGRRMGHAGAIVSGKGESAAEKVELLKEAGIHIIPNPSEMGSTMKEVINKHL